VRGQPREKLHEGRRHGDAAEGALVLFRTGIEIIGKQEQERGKDIAEN